MACATDAIASHPRNLPPPIPDGATCETDERVACGTARRAGSTCPIHDDKPGPIEYAMGVIGATVARDVSQLLDGAELGAVEQPLVACADKWHDTPPGTTAVRFFPCPVCKAEPPPLDETPTCPHGVPAHTTCAFCEGV